MREVLIISSSQLEEDIIREYRTGKGVNRLANEYTIKQKDVYDILKGNGIEIRKRGGIKKELNPEEVCDLIYLYKDEGWILNDLTKKFKTSRENIKDILKENNVELRFEYNKTHYNVGAVFNSYTYLGDVSERRNRKIYWKVRCECGTEKELSKWDVIGGKSKHCGCKIKAGDRVLIVDREEYMSNTIYKEYQKSARKRGLSFSLEFNFFKNIVKEKCHYCGIFNHSTRTDSNTGHKYDYVGIDRKYNDVGYEISNVVPCCFRCNRMKSTTNYDDFLDIIQKIHNNVIMVGGEEHS